MARGVLPWPASSTFPLSLGSASTGMRLSFVVIAQMVSAPQSRHRDVLRVV
jgi:hypothetical protein